VFNKIYALDDDAEYIELYKEYSENFSVSFVGFQSHSELFNSSLTQNDLLIIDVYMPDIDGIDIVEHLAKRNFAGQLVIISGADERVTESIYQLCERLGLNALPPIAKPVSIKEFVKLFNRLPKSNDKNEPQKKSELQSITKKDLIEYLHTGEIYPVFQPQVRAFDDCIVGLECLSRVAFIDDRKEAIKTFIAQLEKLRLISSYTLQFIDKSLSDLNLLLGTESALNIAFNVSVHSLNKSFTDEFIELIKKHQVDPTRIVLEVTETSAIKMESEALYAVTKLKVFGVMLSIDDFGTGYSAIRQLIELPFEELKIDGSFISALSSKETAKAVIDASIYLTKALHFKLVAEGVETEDQLLYLKQFDNCIVQGYIYSEPLTLEELVRFFDTTSLTIA
jgi:EAL domain-containing protein (putative c-di-GMP-specific phosphodiesterase class I)